MYKVLVLNRDEVANLITPKLAIKAVENAYLQCEQKTGSNWPMVFHDFETGKADLDIKSGDLKDTYGLKVVSWMADNSQKDLPQLMSTVLLFERETGRPIALMNAQALTGCRTGAAGVIGAKYLAREDSTTLLMAGCGHIGSYLVACALIEMKNIKKVLIIDPLNPEKTANQLEHFKEEVEKVMAMDQMKLESEIIACDNMDQATMQADIIFTATPSRQPIIHKEFVKAGTHISCIGADMEGKEEIDPALFSEALVVGDDQNQCLTVGECEIPFKKGIISGLDATIGSVIAGKEGRKFQEQITIFDSTGIALQDLSTSAVIIEKAKEQNLGTTIEL